MPELLGALVTLGALALWIYCLIDVVRTASDVVQHLPKVVWFVIVLLFGAIGGLLWLFLGRPRPWQRRDDVGRGNVGRGNVGRGNVGRGDRDHPVSRDPGTGSATALDDGDLHGLHPLVRQREEEARRRVAEAQRLRRLEASPDEVAPGDERP